jgi:hypothetical protein
LDRRLGGPQSRSGRGDEEKNFQPLPRLEPPIIQPIAQRYATEISRILVERVHDYYKTHVAKSTNTLLRMSEVRNKYFNYFSTVFFKNEGAEEL